MAENDVSLALSGDEALVLFDLLSRWIDDEKGTSIRTHIHDDAELWALNNVLVTLERMLVTPFSSEYRQRLGEARERLRTKSGGAWPG